MKDSPEGAGAADVSAAVRDIVGGVELSVLCQPRAARSALVGMHGGSLKVKVRAAPVEGRANEALLGLLAEALGVPRARLSLMSGGQSRRKRIRAEGVGRPEVLAALQARLS